MSKTLDQQNDHGYVDEIVDRGYIWFDKIY